MADISDKTPAEALDFILTMPENGGGVEDGKGNATFYEDGTWTPVLQGATTAGDYTLESTQFNNYSKIGNTVFIELYLRVDTINTAGSGNLLITGLPYENKDDSGFTFKPREIGLNIPSGYTNFIGQTDIFGSPSDGILFYYRSSGTESTVQIGDIASGDYIIGSFFYHT